MNISYGVPSMTNYNSKILSNHIHVLDEFNIFSSNFQKCFKFLKHSFAASCLEGVIKTKRVPWETHLVC